MWHLAGGDVVATLVTAPTHLQAADGSTNLGAPASRSLSFMRAPHYGRWWQYRWLQVVDGKPCCVHLVKGPSSVEHDLVLLTCVCLVHALTNIDVDPVVTHESDGVLAWHAIQLPLSTPTRLVTKVDRVDQRRRCLRLDSATLGSTVNVLHTDALGSHAPCVEEVDVDALQRTGGASACLQL